jgi:hypothetical protein
MSKHKDELKSSSREAKSKASKPKSRSKILDTVAKTEKMATDAILGKYFKNAVRAMYPDTVKPVETIGKVVSAVVGFDYDDWQKGKFTPSKIDLADPNWLKEIAGSILTSKSNKGGK